jgi:hypothetical protein
VVRTEQERRPNRPLRRLGIERLDATPGAACMRLRRGELTAGSAGAQLVEDAFSTMARHAIAAPTQIADMLLPPVLGCW